MKKILIIFITTMFLYNQLSYSAENSPNLFGYQLGENINIKNNLFFINGTPINRIYIDNNFQSNFFSSLELTTNNNGEINNIKSISYPNNFYLNNRDCLRILHDKSILLTKYYKENYFSNNSYIFGNNLLKLKNIMNYNNDNQILNYLKFLTDTNILKLGCEENYSPAYNKNIFYIYYELSNINSLLNNNNKESNQLKNPINNLFGIDINNFSLDKVPNLSYASEDNINNYYFNPSEKYNDINSYELYLNPIDRKINTIKGSSKNLSIKECLSLLKESYFLINNHYTNNIFANSDLDLNKVIYSIYDEKNKTNLNISCEKIPNNIYYHYLITLNKE